jgi:hypothetical protein
LGTKALLIAQEHFVFNAFSHLQTPSTNGHLKRPKSLHANFYTMQRLTNLTSFVNNVFNADKINCIPIIEKSSISRQKLKEQSPKECDNFRAQVRVLHLVMVPSNFPTPAILPPL